MATDLGLPICMQHTQQIAEHYRICVDSYAIINI